MTKRASPRYDMTPVSKKTGKRLHFYVSRKDSDKVTRGPGVKGIVTDLDTKETYRIEGKECSLPGCYCDAYATRLSN